LNVADLGNKGEDGNDGLRQEHQNEHGSADDENENAQPEEESVERNLAIRRSEE
jgi:hypothetical protein